MEPLEQNKRTEKKHKSFILERKQSRHTPYLVKEFQATYF